MIKGVSRDPIPFVVEEDRNSPMEEQTIFWIKPKTGHEANQTMARYAAAGRDGRKGYRDLNVGKLDNADIEEFLAICTRVENFWFAGDEKPTKIVEGPVNLTNLCRELSSDVLIELMDASNNLSVLEAGAKKGYSSLSTSSSGKQKTA